MSDLRLEDLRRHINRITVGGKPFGNGQYIPVTASEVASVLSDADLFTELRRRDLYPRHFDRWLRGKNYQPARSE